MSTSAITDHVAWTVEGSHWDLPDDVAALVAPPVVVSAQIADRRGANTRFLLPPLPRRNRGPVRVV